MKLVYGVKDKPRFPQLIVFAIQQLLAIMAATLVVPVITNGSANLTGTEAMDPAACCIVRRRRCRYASGTPPLTKFKSPVFLGFLPSHSSAPWQPPLRAPLPCRLGPPSCLIIGAVFAGLVYVVIAIIVKLAGVKWINKLMPAVVIGPTVSIIGLSLAGNAVGDLKTAPAGGNTLIAVLCGLVTLAVVILCSTFGKKTAKLIPFILGILAGYAVATIFTVIGMAADIDALKVINFEPLKALVAAKMLANCVQNSFNSMEQAVRTCNPLTGDYYILNCSEIPSVIAECGFLSNPEDEALLITDEYQDDLAYAIFKGVVDYLAQETTTFC